MKQQIEETLRCLVGQPFWGAGRAADLLTFQFGPRQWRTNRRGQAHEVGTYALHVQCAWHLGQAGHILVASRDLYYEPSDEHEKMSHSEREPYAWPEMNTSLLDERLFHFFQQCEKMPIFVQSLYADDFGSLTIALSEDHTLAVFPDDSLGEEYWRFFGVGKTDSPHFVVTGQGIEGEEEADV